MHKSPWIHYADPPLFPTATRWDSGMVAAAAGFCPVASSAVGPVLGSPLNPAAAPNRHNASLACPTRHPQKRRSSVSIGARHALGRLIRLSKDR